MFTTQHLPILEAPAGRGPITVAVRPQGIPLCLPPCECVDCVTQFRSDQEQNVDRFVYERDLPTAKATQIVAKHMEGIQSHRAYLQRMCVFHGNTITNRWRKKSRDKREACLLQADPTMYPQQWFLPRLTYEFPHWTTARAFRKTWLAPYINLEALKSDPARFLSILHNRSQYSPEQWAPYDNKQIGPGWAYGGFALEHYAGCVVMQGPKYGQLTKWEKDAAHRFDIIGFPRAQLILEAQENILSLLRNIVEQILEGVDTSKQGQSTSEKWMQITRLGFREVSRIEFASPFLNQPFSAPPLFDIDNHLSMARARMQAAKDHLWLLQTEPSYMRFAMKDLNQGAAFEVVSRADSYSIMAHEFIHDVMVFVSWQWVVDEWENVKTTYLRYRDSIYPGQRLPEKFDNALGALELMLVNQLHIRSRNLGAFNPQRPGFRHLWVHQHVKPGEITLRRATKMSMPEIFAKDPLDWCLTQMQGDPDDPRRFDHAMLFAFLDQHLSTAPASERARMDQKLYDKLSDYAANHEMLTAVRLHRPLNTSRDIDDVRKTEQRPSWKYIGEDHRFQNNEVDTMSRLLDEFYYLRLPSGKKDLFWLEYTEQIRAALSSFWASMRRYCEKWQKNLKLGPENALISQDVLSADSDADYRAAVEAEKAEIMERIASKSIALAEPASKEAIQTQWGSDEEPKPSSTDTKSKPKKRAEPDPPLDTKLASMPISKPIPPLAPSVPILVKSRTIDTLSLMFPISSGTSEPQPAVKAIDWDTFVLAMSDSGFLARHTGGSAVVFEKHTADDDHGAERGRGGRIVFHKPHPVAKIDPVMFRCMGRRMQKWFGWSREIFAVKSE